MSDIQRWAYQYGGMTPFHPSPGGGWVAYADHVAALLTQDRQHMEQQAAAVAAAEQRAGEEAHGHYMDGYNTAWSLSAAEIERQVREEEQVAQSLAVAESFAAGVKAARDAVAALPVLLVDVRFNPDDASRYVGAVNVSDALAAIDALLGESNG